MGDLVTTTVKKEGGSSSIKCPMLNTTNYTVWSIRMKMLLRVHKVWEVVEQESTNDEKNDMASALLFQSIPESMILQVGGLDTAKKIWEAIKTRHVGADRVREARLQTLMTEFERLKMKETDKIDDFVGKLSEISSKSAALGENMEEAKLVKKFLQGLPHKKYIHIVASLEQLLDLNNTGFEDVVGRLKAYEERISAEEEEDTQESQSKLMYMLMIHEIVYLNERNVKPKEFDSNTDGDRIWYLDNGASNHMTGNRSYFRSIDETITGKVCFGDDSRIDIKGKGSVLFVSQDGRRKILADVYFIPELKSNIISLGQATESGCDVRMRKDYLTLHDKTGNLIVKAPTSKNRLYKVIMEVEQHKCLQLEIKNDYSRWHARLGHLGADAMKSMVGKELVTGREGTRHRSSQNQSREGDLRFLLTW
ncbi:PREDICTED: uncharacterized protein LOC106323590 [Brassica oleracea var. oleracea]|uniref:uncharacterized protein LOC106323590 n=1 Tax=Brassica oleracea var. oleracea TaxID=109376 RepID=UPI0006A73DAB|nr:PREDICTED: uncharacterized protein LOC106323590 [Brassica oleracea var. oleracea]